MPKHIDNLQEIILRQTRKQIQEHGMVSVSMRSIANDCGVASGTLYNYFASKDIMIASVMLEDWNVCLDVIREVAAKATSLREIYAIVYEQINVFTDMYSNDWKAYHPSSATEAFILERHAQLIHQLADLMAPDVMRISGNAQMACCQAAVELILQRCRYQGRDGFDDLAPVLEKLLS